MERDWERLGRLMAAGRQDIGLTQVQVAEEIGVTRTPVQAIERGRQPNGREFVKITGTMRSYARLLNWTDDSLTRVLAGGEPQYTDDERAPVTPATPTSGAGLPVRIAQAIAEEGHLLDATIIPLPGMDESEGEIIAIVKGKPNASPEELRRMVDAWKRAQAGMRNGPEDQNPPRANEA